MGLSGDLPILLVRTNDHDATRVLEDLVMAHRLWRENGLASDLVVLSESASGYVEPVGDRLIGILSDHGQREQLGRRGGIHYLSADQLSSDDRRLLQVAANARFETRNAELSTQLESMVASRSALPVFSPSRWEAAREPTPALERPGDLLFDNGLGGFTRDGREYVIFLASGEATPAPWSNVLANEEFGTLSPSPEVDSPGLRIVARTADTVDERSSLRPRR